MLKINENVLYEPKGRNHKRWNKIKIITYKIKKEITIKIFAIYMKKNLVIVRKVLIKQWKKNTAMEKWVLFMSNNMPQKNDK